MNKSGQTPITFIFMIITFLIGWAMFGAKFLSDAGQQYITINNASGFEAFFYGNLNLLVLFCLIIVIIAYGTFGNSQ